MVTIVDQMFATKIRSTLQRSINAYLSFLESFLVSTVSTEQRMICTGMIRLYLVVATLVKVKKQKIAKSKRMVKLVDDSIEEITKEMIYLEPSLT